MGKRLIEIIKTGGLLIVFCFLLLLLISLPRAKSFETNNWSSGGFLNLGNFLRLGLGASNRLETDRNGWTHFLILGKPGAGNPAPNLTDSIIVASLKDNRAVFLSIPRDLYVFSSKLNNYRKINSLYASGVGLTELKKTISQIIGKEIHYVAVIDLMLLKEITDYLGGINVYVKENIYDPDFPGANYSYEPFELKKGWRHLDGELVIKYARTRYGAEGDFGRMKRQRDIVASIKNKITNLSHFENFNFVLALYNDFRNHIETDLDVSEIKGFWQLSKKIDISSSQAIGLTNKNPALLRDSYIDTAQGKMFVLIPQQGINDYAAIQQYVNQVYENL